MAWIIFLAIAIPLLAVLAWTVLDESVVRIEPGRLGLLLVRGKATDRAFEPGPHWVPAFRRRMVQEYPSLELSFRAGVDDPGSGEVGELERSGPSLRVVLGDRMMIIAAYTVRFRLKTDQLRLIHERFGTDGIWAAVRDESARSLRAALAAPDVSVDDLFGPARQELEARLTDAVAAALDADGFEVTMFHLGDLDLGRTGEVIQATVRARLELEREQAEAEMRVTRARIDADLAPFVAVTTTEAALRYREVDSWRDLAATRLLLPTAPRPSSPEPAPATPPSEAAPPPLPAPEEQ